MSELNFHFLKRNTLLFAIFFLIFESTVYISNDMIMPGMLKVIRDFQADDQMVSVSFTAFVLGGGCLQLFLGPISDRIGRKPVLLFGVIFFILCSIFLACSQSINQFLLGRFLQGMGLCFITVVGYATIQEIYTDIPAVRLISKMNSISIVAPLIGPLLGAIILQFFGWRMIFLVSVILGSIALSGIWKYMPETIGAQKTDGTINHPTPFTKKIIKENYLSLLTNKHFMLGSLGISVATIPIVAWIGTGPLILMKNANLSSMNYALMQIPIFFACILGNVAVNRLIGDMTLNKVSTLGSWIIALSLLALIPATYLSPENYIAIVILLSVYAFGLSFISTALTRLTLFSTAVPKGTASAVMSILLNLIIAGGNAISGFLYVWGGNQSFCLYCAFCGLLYALLFTLYEICHRDKLIHNFSG